MSKEFSKSFYNSKAWKKCRQSYISERILVDGGLCEICGKEPGYELHHIEHLTINNIKNSDVTLNQDNLLWVCKDCHFAVHKESILKAFQSAKRKKVLTNGVWFDEMGMIQPQQVKIVYGAPSSGKTTYVSKHKNHNDLVVDLDLINSALSMTEVHKSPDNLLNIAWEVRDLIYNLIEQKKVDCKIIWIVGTLAKKNQRNELASRLNAELILINSTYDECMERMNNDTTRENKLKQKLIIEKWFEEYEE